MDKTDYLIGWLIYLLAALPFCVIAWRVFKRYFWRELAYFCEGILLAMLFTPWYVLADQEILAPAMIVFVMDTITINSTEGVRALIPLVMSFLLVIITTIILSIIYRIKKRKSKKMAPLPS